MRDNVGPASLVVLNVISELRLQPHRLGFQVWSHRVHLEYDAIATVDLLFYYLHAKTYKAMISLCNLGETALDGMNLARLTWQSREQLPICVRAIS